MKLRLALLALAVFAAVAAGLMLLPDRETEAYTPAPSYLLNDNHSLAYGYFRNKLNCPERALDILSRSDRGEVSARLLTQFASSGTTFVAKGSEDWGYNSQYAVNAILYVIKSKPDLSKGLPKNLDEYGLDVAPGLEKLFTNYDEYRSMYEALSSTKPESREDILRIHELQCLFNEVSAKINPEVEVVLGTPGSIDVVYQSKANVFTFSNVRIQDDFLDTRSIPNWVFCGHDEAGMSTEALNMIRRRVSIDAPHTEDVAAYTASDKFVLNAYQRNIGRPRVLGAEFVPPHVYTGKFMFFDSSYYGQPVLFKRILGSFRAESNVVTVRAILPKTKSLPKEEVSSLITGIADATDYDLDLFDPYVHADKSQAFKALTKLGLPAVPAIVESLDRLDARRKVLALLALTEITGLRSRDIERYSTIRQPVPDSIAIELFEPSPAYLSASFGQSIAWWRNFVEENAASWE